MNIFSLSAATLVTGKTFCHVSVFIFSSWFDVVILSQQEGKTAFRGFSGCTKSYLLSTVLACTKPCLGLYFANFYKRLKRALLFASIILSFAFFSSLSAD